MWCCLRDLAVSHFDTVPACDYRRTHDDSIYRAPSHELEQYFPGHEYNRRSSLNSREWKRKEAMARTAVPDSIEQGQCVRKFHAVCYTFPAQRRQLATAEKHRVNYTALAKKTHLGRLQATWSKSSQS